jgi:hypothetical protein
MWQAEMKDFIYKTKGYKDVTYNVEYSKFDATH